MFIRCIGFKNVLLCIAFIFVNFIAVYSQNIQVKDIIVEGLTRTKLNVVLMELNFKTGDSINLINLSSILEQNEKRLLSTRLFSQCDINIKYWDEVNEQVVFIIKVRELLQILPGVIFELADRNFNVWWKEMEASLSRVNYGIRVDHQSLTGNKDRTKLILQTGYTNKFEIEYLYPYLFNTWGLGLNVFYSTNKEIGYISQNNKVLFKKFDDERVLLKRFRAGLQASTRFNAFSNQYIKLEYHHNKVNDSVSEDLNPNYFPNKDNFIKYAKLQYTYEYNKTIFPNYPEGGYAYKIEGQKDGLGFGNYNNLSLTGEIEKHIRLKQKLILSGKIKARYSFTKDQLPYSNNTALGYGADVIRGYELYVMDGQSFAWAKASTKYKILSNSVDLGRTMFIKPLRIMPIQIFLKAINEYAYAYEKTYVETNTLNNRMLVGYGAGIDLILYNGFFISVEYNINQLSERGFYFKFNSSH
jgi:outer membrane protein assembly factor BamA